MHGTFSTARIPFRKSVGTAGQRDTTGQSRICPLSRNRQKHRVKRDRRDKSLRDVPLSRPYAVVLCLVRVIQTLAIQSQSSSASQRQSSLCQGVTWVLPAGVRLRGSQSACRNSQQNF